MEDMPEGYTAPPPWKMMTLGGVADIQVGRLIKK